MNTLFECPKDNEITAIGKGFAVKFISEYKYQIYRHGQIDREVTFLDKFDKRIYICQLVCDYKLIKKKAALGFCVDEKMLRMWLTVYETEGALGLRNSTKTGVGRPAKDDKLADIPLSRRAQAYKKENRLQDELLTRSKSDALLLQTLEMDFDAAHEVVSDLYSAHYNWEESRYGAVFLYLSMIEHNYKALSLFHWFLGDNTFVMILFIVMQVLELPSIESLKTAFKTEMGRVLGIDQLYSLPVLWKKIHETVDQRASKLLRLMLFKTQISKSLVSLWVLFIDGHFLPYTGKEKVHLNFHTQSREMRPGQNEIFIHDQNGKIVYFDIQEGKGDMFGVIKEKSKEYAALFNGIAPLFVVDRELWGVKNFIELLDYRFITWEKNSKKEELDALSDKLFDTYLQVNGTDYGLYETRKTYYDKDKNSIELKRIIIWNTRTKVRSGVVTNDAYESLTTLATAMLNRWGKSENSFKHTENRFNMYYNPVFDITELSEKQEINNPQYIKIEGEIRRLKSEISQNEKKIGKKKLRLNKNETLRKNTSRDTLTADIETKKGQIKDLQKILEVCPKRINTSDIEGCKPFKKIATEGKALWNIAEVLVWNSRKEMEKIMKEFIPNHRDRLPVLDAITKCKSRIRSTKHTIFVQFEPLERPAFYQAQCQFVNKMNLNSGNLFNQKKLHFEVKKWR